MQDKCKILVLITEQTKNTDGNIGDRWLHGKSNKCGCEFKAREQTGELYCLLLQHVETCTAHLVRIKQNCGTPLF